MARPRRNKILSGLEAKDFIGRAAELERLTAHAERTGPRLGLTLLAPPGVGTSELLKQTFDRLFLNQKEVVPFYFDFRTGDINASHTAERFVYEFILQTVAFRRQDDSIIASSPGLEELSQLAAPADGKWIDKLVEAIDKRFETSTRPFIRDCLAAPGRAAAQGARVFAILDDVHAVHQLDPRFFEELKEVFFRAGIPYVFAARRRFAFRRIDAGRMLLEPLSFADAGRLVETTAERHAVALNDQTRDLIAVQLDANAQFMTAVVREAGEKSISLDSFQNFQQVYADSVFGGGISRWFDDIVERSVPAAAEEAMLDVLYDTAVLQDTGVAVDAWRRALEKHSASKSLDLLNLHEIVRITANRVELPPENISLFDYTNARRDLEIEGHTRALVYGRSLASFIVRAPDLMREFYRRSSAIGVRDLLSSFSGQTVPLALVDYGKFRDDFKGMPDNEVLTALGESHETLTLPRIFFVADAATFYKGSDALLEIERVSAGQGYQGESASEKEEIVWLAAEIDSKMEASAELAASWCDRLEAIADASDFTNFRVWLVAPEGFSTEAEAVLIERNAFGSSRKQFELLRGELGGASSATAGNEYEIVLPMGEDAELIAANAVEEIARRYNFTSKAINQIKTALVEACINASEHSLSPDQKIYQKFAVDGEKLTITISNRGLRLADKQPAESEPTEGRRGWGLQLMRRLMDEVTIEDVDDGTRISMTKYINPPETRIGQTIEG
jgi:serine/threonine-protein kinase RsbW